MNGLRASASGVWALALVAIAVFLAPSIASAAQERQARLNYEYRVIPQQPTLTGERVEVIEFFWYGCPYCNQLEPALESWIARKPADVALRRIPAVFRESWIPHARLYYTLEALGQIDRLHQAVYRAHHVEHRDVASAESSADWAAENGLDRARWLAVYNSAEVENNVRRAIEDTYRYAIRGTPSLVVDGRYVTSTGMSETIPGVISILDDLIAMARSERTPR